MYAVHFNESPIIELTKLRIIIATTYSKNYITPSICTTIVWQLMCSYMHRIIRVDGRFVEGNIIRNVLLNIENFKQTKDVPR